MPDRTWGEGLHQAIEAKENLPIRENTETVASITYQNFFLLYPKLAGMTGTAKTAELEFEKIYNLSVDEIPTAQLNKRRDLPDLIYKDQLSKWSAIAKECQNVSLTGQPILIGTTTVEKSEMLAELLNEYKLSYQLLNAKPENVRKESEIVAQAGQKGSITIATNMAGRGTDIQLGGNLEFAINTNGCPPGDQWTTFIEKINILTERGCVKRFDLYTSAEAYGDRNDYIRDGMNWDLFRKNIRRDTSLYPVLENDVFGTKWTSGF